MSLFSELDSEHSAKVLCKECIRGNWTHTTELIVSLEIKEQKIYTNKTCGGDCPLRSEVKSSGY